MKNFPRQHSWLFNRFSGLIFSAFICLTNAVVIAQDNSFTPFLRVETGTHTASITGVAADLIGNFVVTASEDKTARMWDAKTGKLLRILRPPLGADSSGKIHSVAVSPDGNIIAVGVAATLNLPDNIYLFDSSNGRVIRRLGDLSTTASELIFSFDGSYLAAALYNGKLRIYDTISWQYRENADCRQSELSAIDFAPDSRQIVTDCFDGIIRAYSVTSDLRLLKTQPISDGKTPSALKFSPDGNKIALVFEDSTAVEVLSATDLSLLYAPNSTGLVGDLFGVAWSASGEVIFAGGRNRKNGNNRIRFWKDAGRGAFDETNVAQTSIFDLQTLSDGNVIYGSADAIWGILDRNGKILRRVMPEISNSERIKSKFVVSNDGAEIGFAYENDGRSPAKFSLLGRRLETGVVQTKNLIAPRTTSLRITDWQHSRHPKLNGTKLKIFPREASFSLAIAPDDSEFLLGANWSLRLYNRDGKLSWNIQVPAAAYGVNVSGDGRLAIAAFGDGTIRWFRLSDGKELLAFFPHSDKKRWVLWTPTGYYDASPDAENLIGWHLNNGSDASGDFYPAAKFRQQFYRPDIISLVLQTLDEPTAIEMANKK